MAIYHQLAGLLLLLRLFLSISVGGGTEGKGPDSFDEFTGSARFESATGAPNALLFIYIC